VLANLAVSYERRGDGRRLDRVLTDQIALAPADPLLLARRGEARARFGDRAGALCDLNVALAALPCGAAFERVHEQARVLARLGASTN
jgi:regulator of sirC expression with transglutaminase-like and TPR domain